MAIFLPQQILPARFVILYIGNMAIKLPRFKFGDVKAVKLRQRVHRDLIVRGKYWPRERTLTMTFGGLKRDGVLPTNNMINEFLKATRIFPGQAARLVFPGGKSMTGTIQNPVLSEVAASTNCQYDVSFTFDIYREYPLTTVD